MSTGESGNLAHEQAHGSPFQNHIGYRLVAWEADRAVVALTIAPAHLNRTGLLHGGIIATLLDTASGYSGTYCAVPGHVRTTLTLSLTTNFVASVREGAVRAEGRRTGGGRSIFFTWAELRDDHGQLLATASGAFKYLPGGGDPQGRPRAAGG